MPEIWVYQKFQKYPQPCIANSIQAKLLQADSEFDSVPLYIHSSIRISLVARKPSDS